ncbi:LytTR family DNA-binding domain-containing protein [Mucilaginibacter sp. L3T2-6]|uniref:LytR/AlgR family response regulator transcription factor n=1 Tax=Mucilaginibacter sp. L3T2-6 TaxID=3062491 RepID=UPI0026765FA7|nr:LytTR family DNA-binding domain-containing protein [Mucilaginibacter sp. L3T2-6]MDO3641294.1 LytTR family DNA-binding domain-containing protein [Mucilaginibacter sp. L3T2-6]MDV6213946.1 LytTR family DNA-binding domain-containing protein [Mucilaginibacter sp. L3T2-6]
MRIRCLIIDDKPLAIDILADYTRKVPFLELTGTATDPIQGLSMVRDRQISLVFLDIQMPQLNGLQFMRIAGEQCKVILTTAYPEYALEGFEHDVIDYLLKPIAFDRFYRAAAKALQVLGHDSKNRLSAENEMFSDHYNQSEYLFIKTEHRIKKVNLRDILFIESLQNYITLHTTAGRILSLQTMKKLENQLPPKEFMRVHKSYIVSLRHISSVERSRIQIGGQLIPVGDIYRDAFYKIIGH